MVVKKFLIYLSEVVASSDALNEVRKHKPDNAIGYLIDILTFEGIYKKIPMNEDQDLENARLRLERLGDKLKIDPSRQFVTIGEPGQKLVSCIINFQINALLISDNLFNRLNEPVLCEIKNLNCAIFKIDS